MGYRNKTAVQYHWYALTNSFPKVRMGKVSLGGAIITASNSKPWLLLCTPGVALILYLDLIKAQWFPIVTATVVSTLLVLVVTGQMHQLVIKFDVG